MDQQLEMCVEIFKNADLTQQIVYGAFVVLLIVFAFMKKSLPQFLRDSAGALVKAFSQKNKK